VNFMHVWLPFVDTYLKLGWMFANSNPMVYADGGGHPSFLMKWPCECKCPYLKKREW
jgi:hypothetical protein